MASSAEIFPGAVPARGALRPGGVLSAQRGANGALFIHPQGKRVISVWCGADSSVDVWSVDPLRPVSSTPAEVELPDTGATIDHLLMPPGVDASRSGWPAHLLPIVDLAASANGSLFAMAAGRGVRLYQPNSAGDIERVGVLRGHEQAVVRVAASSAGDRVVSTEGSGRVLVWGVPERRVQLDLKITRAPHSAAFLWSDLLVGIGDDIGRVVCWELQEGRRHLQFQAHRGPVQRLVFSQETGSLLTVGADNTARLWNLETGKQSGGDMHHAGPIHDAAFAYEGRFVVTVGSDGHVAIWSAATGHLIDWCFEGSPVYRVAYHAATGLVLYSGPRSIRAAEIDWTAIKKAEAGGAPLAASPTLFSQPPARPAVTYAGPAQQEAPIGSVMAARQTSDLPMPDRSNLAINRDQQSASTGPVAFPLGGGARPFGTQALPSIGAAPGPQFGARPGATVAMSGIGAGGGPASQPMPGSAHNGLGAPTFGAQNVLAPGQDPRAHTTIGRGGYGSRQSMATGTSQIVGASSSGLADADDFFAGSFGSSDAGSMLDSSRPPGALPTVAHAPPATRESPPQPSELRPAMPPGEAPSFDDVLRADEPAAAGRAIAVIAPRPKPSKRILYAGLLLGLLSGLAGRIVVENHYIEDAYPPSVASEANALESVRDAAIRDGQAALDTFRAEREERVFQVERSGSLAASEIDRLRANVERQIGTAERDFEQVRTSAEAEFEAGLQVLEGARRDEAASLGTRYGAIGGVAMFLLAVLVHLIVTREKSEPVKPVRGARPPSRPRRP